jgi:benzylsuccinate CoA-transferase BbsE subunit
MGGQLYLCGYPDAPPVRPAGHQAWQQASLHAAYSTLIAAYSRDANGTGQHVDVSVQAAIAADLQNTMAAYDLTAVVRKRVGSRLVPCKDGYVRLLAGRGWDELVDWMGGYGMAGDLRDPRWQDPLVRRTEEEHFNELVELFCLQFTRREIFEEALRRRIPITPSNTSADLVEDPHLIERGYFVEVDHPELDRSFTYPGAPFRHSETPWQLRRRAPLVGEDNDDIYLGELHLTHGEMSALKQKGVV